MKLDKEELMKRKIELRNHAGRLTSELLTLLKQTHPHVAAETSEYIITALPEDAEGTYQLREGLEWVNPTDEENVHLELIIQEAQSGRFLPHLRPLVTIFDDKGKKIGEKVQEFYWSPVIYHYAANWVLPGDGKYTIQVEIEPPTFHRHHKEMGKVFEKKAVIKLPEIEIKTGRKER